MILLLLLAVLVHAAAERHVLATISTTSGTSPSFSCKQDVLLFQPLGASASLHRAGGSCVLQGASMAGEYIVGNNVIKAIDLHSPVRNLGGSIIFRTTWCQNSFTDADSLADAWRAVEGCEKNDTLHQDGKLAVSSGCGLVGRPHEARTINFFRSPLLLSVNNVSTLSGATARFAFQVPTEEEMQDTDWSVSSNSITINNAKTARD